MEKVAAYFSRTLNKPERRYCVTRKELIAIVAAVKQIHHYLYGQRFVVRTDHEACTTAITSGFSSLYWIELSCNDSAVSRFESQEGTIRTFIHIPFFAHIEHILSPHIVSVTEHRRCHDFVQAYAQLYIKIICRKVYFDSSGNLGFRLFESH